MGVVGWVAYKIIVTSPEAKFLFPFLGPGFWTGNWPWACQFALIAQIVVWVTKATLNIDVVPNTNNGNAGKPIPII